MPISLVLSVCAGFLGAVAFRFFGPGAPTDEMVVSVALDTFNAAAILCFFFLMAKARDHTQAEFGKLMQNNLSTIVIALMILLIQTLLGLEDAFTG